MRAWGERGGGHGGGRGVVSRLGLQGRFCQEGEKPYRASPDPPHVSLSLSGYLPRRRPVRNVLGQQGPFPYRQNGLFFGSEGPEARKYGPARPVWCLFILCLARKRGGMVPRLFLKRKPQMAATTLLQHHCGLGLALGGSSDTSGGALLRLAGCRLWSQLGAGVGSAIAGCRHLSSVFGRGGDVQTTSAQLSHKTGNLSIYLPG